MLSISSLMSDKKYGLRWLTAGQIKGMGTGQKEGTSETKAFTQKRVKVFITHFE